MPKKPRRFLSDQKLEPFFQGVDEFCKKNLPNSFELSNEGAYRSKTIADPVEGYASAEAWEIAIIDTPLFQRLRYIRQLGVAYLVYPTLGYSRFEHTVGVMARLKQLVTSLRENLKDRDERERLTHLDNDKNMMALRLAALCHDIGHCMFSHLAEAVISTLPAAAGYPSGPNIREAFEKAVGRAVPMAEIFSASIICSIPFIDFLQKIGIPDVNSNDKAFELANKATNLVLGLPFKNDPDSLYMAQLMSSGLDVDKLDYMMRESHLSGITLGISLDWLLKKLSVTRLSAKQVPEGLQKRISNLNNDAQFSVLSLGQGGQFAFEEFCVARLALHEKIYLHHKIRAAEAYVRRQLACFAREVKEFSKAHNWLYLRESMIEYQNLELPNLEPVNLFNQDQKKRETSSLGLQCLIDRQLLYRGFAFGWQNAIAEPIAEPMEQSGSGTDILMKLVQDRPEYFLSSVRDKYNEIVELLRNQEEAIPLGVPEILVDPPSFSTIQQGHYTLHMEHPTKVAVRWTMPIDKIVEYYQRNRALAYVFGSKEHLPYILLATEKAIWDEWKLVYVQESFVNKQVVSLAADLKIKLDGINYYHDALELRPVSDFLNSVYAQSLVGCIAQKLAIYESRTKKRVTPSSVTTFVAQFPDELQPVALEWLQYIDWIEPEDLLQGAISEIKNDQKFNKCKKIALCPLGASSDSAQRIAYYLREKIGDERIVMRSIHEVPGENLDAYILYDDNINTGLQALNIVNSWFGSKLPEDLTLTEDHVSTLTAELIDALKRRPVAFVFGVGVEGACDKLADRLSELLKFDRKLLICVAQKELKEASRVFSGSEAKFQHVDKLKLKTFLVNVARELLIAEGKSSEIAQEKTLGYRGAEAMVVFPYNTPTMTITALWIGGEFQGRPWVPLVERGRRTHGIGGELVGEDD